MILNSVVSTARKQISNFCPFIAMHLMGFKYQFFLLFVKGVFLDVRIEMVVPSFTALFSCSTVDAILFREHLGDECPFFAAILGYEYLDGIIFLVI